MPPGSTTKGRRSRPRLVAILIAVAAIGFGARGVHWLVRHSNADSILTEGRNFAAEPAKAYPARATTETLATGVVHVGFPTGRDSGIDIIDVDLAQAAYRPAILSEKLNANGGQLTGDAYTPADWTKRCNALAAMNGGYFGDGPDNRKPVVGLFVAGGKTLQTARPIRGHGGTHVDPGLYVRSAFGVTSDGNPQIVWAATPSKGGTGVYAYTTPVDPAEGYRWHMHDAVGCGPTLIRAGKVVVTDYEERLVSEGPKARTFLAYDSEGGKARHFVMGIASDMTYEAVADSLVAYYRQAHGTDIQRAMCLDGGASTQLSYVENGKLVSPRYTETTVPDAIGLVPR